MNISKPTKIVLWLLAATLLCLLPCGVGGYFGFGLVNDTASASGQLDKAIAEARTAGLPMIAADLSPAPIPDAQNGAIEIDQLTLLLKRQNLKFGGTSAILKLRPDQLKAFLIKHADVLKLAEVAADKPAISFQKDWDVGFSLTYPELPTLKSAVRLLLARATSHAHDGNMESCLQELDRARALTEHASSQPSLIAMLVAISNLTSLDMAAERIATIWADKPALEKLIAWNDRKPKYPDAAHAVRVEFYSGLSMARNLTQEELKRLGEEQRAKPVNPRSLVRKGLPEGVIQRAQLCRFVQRFLPIYRILKDAPVPTMQTTEALRREDDIADSHPQPSYIVAKMLLPLYSRSITAHVNLRARHACTVGLLASLRFRQAQGRWPHTLAEAGCNLIDPMDGKPLRMRQDHGEFRVYSVGQNQLDDGGRTQTEIYGKREAPDIPKGDTIAKYPAR